MRSNGKGNPKHDRTVRRVRPERPARLSRMGRGPRRYTDRSKYDAQGNVKRSRRVAQR